MNGLPMNLNEQKKQALEATVNPPIDGDFEWDGKNEDDQPLSRKEMLAGIRNKGGRPVSGNSKKITTIRLDARILDFFKSRGKGWQTRINDVLQDYINSHPKG